MVRTFLQSIAVLGIIFLLATTFLSESPDSLRPELSYTSPQYVPIQVQNDTEVVEQAAIEPGEVSQTAMVQIPVQAAAPPLVDPEKPIETLYDETEKALVNILCTPVGSQLSPISGSGIIIDPRGIILTNAHVAQFVLLAASDKVNLSCVIRTGSPAQTIWTADILYMPSSWVDEHAKDIRNPHPLGTGENDYALLLITRSVSGASLPAAFPFVSTRLDTAIIKGEPAFLAGYPAEFSGDTGTQDALKATFTLTNVKQLLTFGKSTIDVISFGGVVLAQSGSSGGAAIDSRGRLMGILSTTSEGETTADRNLRAITLSYIEGDLTSDIGAGLESLLLGDVYSFSRAWNTSRAPLLQAAILSFLSSN